jgi:hypothetical protein
MLKIVSYRADFRSAASVASSYGLGRRAAPVGVDPDGATATPSAASLLEQARTWRRYGTGSAGAAWPASRPPRPGLPGRPSHSSALADSTCSRATGGGTALPRESHTSKTLANRMPTKAKLT